MALFGPAGIPKPVIGKLSAAASSGLEQPEMSKLMATRRFEIAVQASEDIVRGMAEEAKLFADVARQIGLKPQ